MLDSIYPALVSGLLTMGLALALLRSGWRNSERRGRARVASGWTALLVSLYLLTTVLGPLIGLTIATLAFGLCGYCLVALNTERRQPRNTRGRIVTQDASPQAFGNGWGRGFAAFFLAMITTIAIGAAAAGLPIGLPVNRVTIGALVLPIIWAGLVIWVLSEARLRRPVLGLCATIGASGLLITVEMLV